MDKDLYIDEQVELLSQIGNTHLFIIGIDAYKNGISPLNNCVRDAEKLKKILTEKYHFLPENVKELYNENASLENIIERLAKYAAKLNENDSLLISFSGHGFYKDEIGYLVPADASRGKIYGLLNNEQLKSYLKSCKAKHILLVVDSCYSGSFLLKDKDANEQKSLANEVAKYKSRWVLAAGRIEKVADGEYGKHSPFATTLHTFLEKNTDKIFCISDLAQYVKNITPHNSNQFPIAGILQDTNDAGGEFVFFPRNNEKEDFELCKTKADFIHFLQKYPTASPARIAQANAQIKAFEELEIAEKAASQRGKAHHLYATILAEQDWEKKNDLVNEYKNRFSEIEEELYLNVLEEGRKADDYPEWKKVNKSSVNAVELFMRKHKHNFFVAEAKVLLNEVKEAEKAKKNAVNLQEEEEKRKQAELNRLAEKEKSRLEKAEEERKEAERLRLEKENAVKVRLTQAAKEAEAKRQAAEKLRLEKEQKETAEKQFVAAANLKEREEKKREESEKAWAERKAFLSKYKYAFMIVPVVMGLFWGVPKLINSSNTNPSTQEANVNILPKENFTYIKGKGIDSLFEMVQVKGGTFQMGDDKSDYDNEKPAHSVTLSDFSIGKTEVTQKQWQAVMGNNPSNFKCEDCPVENISWADVQAFIQKLNKLSTRKYRLPTEAEWEFAARGGTKSKGYKYAGSNDIDEVAWYGYEKADKKMHKVATKKPNELGLYDMSGNVYEWCSDWYGADYYKNSPAKNPQGAKSGEYRVVRGGSWRDYAAFTEGLLRRYYDPTDRNNYVGCRLLFA